MDEVVDAPGPKRFKIEQVAGLFLDRPFFTAAGGQTIGRNAAQEFFEASGRAAKTNTEVGIEIGGKMKFESSFEPLAGVAHKESVAAVKEPRKKSNAAHTRSGRTNWLRRGEGR